MKTFLSLKPLTHKLNTDKVLEKLKIEPHTQLSANIKKSCEIVNLVRSDLNTSDTHPSYAFFSTVEKKSADIKKLMVRPVSYLIAMCLSTLPGFNNQHHNYSLISKYLSVITHFGNCHEYSMLAIDKLKSLYPELKAEVFYLAGGDHVFVVIDRAEESDVNQFTTWGNNAVICDAWAGKVYPSSLIIEKLLDHIPTGIAPFNLRQFNPQTQTPELWEQTAIEKLKDQSMINSLRIYLALIMVVMLTAFLNFSDIFDMPESAKSNPTI